jgi:mannosyltransferase
LPWFGPAVILAIAFGLGIHDLDGQSLWPDEAYSWDLASQPIGTIISQVLDDHVPGYFVLLHGWMSLAGDSAFALRFLSGLFAVLAVALLMALARPLLGHRAALLTGFLAALNPFLLYYGQETRMYALLLVLAALALRLLVDACRSELPTSWRWPAYACTVAAALYVHYYAILLAPVLAVAPVLLTPRRSVWLRNAAWLAVAGGLFVPWAVWRRGVFGHFSPVTAGSVTVPRILTDLVLALHTGEMPFETRRVLAEQRGAWALAAAAVLLACWGAIRGGRRAQLFTLATLLPVAAVVALTLGRRDFSPRHALVVLAGWLPLLSAGIVNVPRLLGAGLALVLLGGFGWSDRQYFANPEFQRQDFRGAVRLLQERAAQGDAVILQSEIPLRPMIRYYAPKLTPRSLPRPLPSSDAELDAVLRSSLGGADRAELVLWQDFADDPEHRVKAWLDREQHPIFGWGKGEVAVYGYFLRDPYADAPPEGLTASGARFSDQIELVGYRQWRGMDDRSMRLQLVWRRLRTPTRDYRVFVHLVDEKGGNVAIADHRPAFDTLNLSQWQGKPILIDEYDLIGDWRRGAQLEIGLYDPASRERLQPASLPLPLTPG